MLATFLAAEGWWSNWSSRPLNGGAARGSVPSLRTPERAVAALAHAVRYGSWLTSLAGTIPDLPGIDTDAARTLLAQLREPDDPPRALTDDELSKLLGCYGIPWVYRAIGSVDEAVTAAAAIGYRWP